MHGRSRMTIDQGGEKKTELTMGSNKHAPPPDVDTPRLALKLVFRLNNIEIAPVWFQVVCPGCSLFEGRARAPLLLLL